MKEKINKLIDKLNKEIEKTQKALDEGLSKYNTSRARQTIKMNQDFIKELEALV